MSKWKATPDHRNAEYCFPPTENIWSSTLSSYDTHQQCVTIIWLTAGNILTVLVLEFGWTSSNFSLYRRILSRFYTNTYINFKRIYISKPAFYFFNTNRCHLKKDKHFGTVIRHMGYRDVTSGALYVKYM